MFKVNDTIMYGTQGICKIVEITEKDFMGSKKEYYVLKPMNDKAATLFAPVNNAKTGGKMRRILSEEEIHQLIESMPGEEANWIPNENERKECYKRIIASGDHVELIKMIKALYIHKQEREAEGKHLYLSDERFFKEAERILYDEFQYVLNIQRDELLPFIFTRLTNSQDVIQ
ncbi:MAG: CarD family transcriptional regulator [Tyzzerella sp.]|nr:CarD family transcriptional regulator [Tyzzerella sp.]